LTEAIRLVWGVRLRVLAALAALLVNAAPLQAALSPAERRMAAVIDAEQPRTLAMLEQWVNQNSGTLNRPGVAAVGQMLRAELEPLGFSVEWIDQAAAGRAGHLIARHRGSGRGKRLLLIGHLDTVFEPDSPFQRWTRRGAWGEGPGAGDDKGGMAVMVAALRAMKAAGTLKAADIEVVLTGDEEDVGNPLDHARRDLIAAGKRADVALDFENLARLDGRDMGSISRRSSANWTVTVTARTGHSGAIFTPALGDGANYELARIVEAFRRELPEPKLSFNVGLFGGGATVQLDEGKVRLGATGKTNIIAAAAVARGDLRAIDQAQIDRAKARMQAIVAASLPGTSATLGWDEDAYPPMPATAGGRALLGRLNIVNRDLGLPAMDELDAVHRGAGDISYVAPFVDGLAGLGAAGRGGHAPGEAVDIPSIALQAKRAAMLMSRIAAEPRKR
jgi:glutamate carboxypeptidase